VAVDQVWQLLDGQVEAGRLPGYVAMTTDALTDEQRRQAEPIVGPGCSWGLGTGIEPGDRWGWSGGTGTLAFVDRPRDTVAVLLTQRGATGPDDNVDDFTAAVAALA